MKDLQLAFFESPEYSRHCAYWKQILDEADGQFRLGGALLCQAPEGQDVAASLSVSLEPAAQLVLDRLSRRSDEGIFAVVTAAVALLISQITGNQRAVIELPSGAGQEADERPLLVVHAQSELTIKDLLIQLTRSIPACHAYRDFPIRSFSAKLKREAGSDVLMASDALHGAIEAGKHHALLVQVAGGADGALRLSSPNRSLPAWLQHQIGMNLNQILASFADVTAPLTSAKKVIVDAASVQVAKFNDTQADFSAQWMNEPGRASVLEIFEHKVNESPDAIAVICGDVSLSYAALDAEAQRLAVHLSGRFGIGRGSLVAALNRRSHWAIITLLATFKAGAAFLPLNPKMPSQGLARVLSESGAGVLIAHSAYLDLVMGEVELPIYAIDLQLPALTAPDPSVSAGLPQAAAGDLAYVIYTSGTTGVPKGVMIAHGGLANTVLEHVQRFELGPRDRYLQFMAMSFDGFLLDTFSALCSGAALVIATEQMIEDPVGFEKYLEQNAVTISTMTPSYLQLLDPEVVGRLRILVSAGEVLSPALARQYAQRLQLYNGYGPSEATINSTLHRVDAAADLALIPVGRPGANKRIYVVNEHMQIQPAGVIGEICIAGEGLAIAYLADPALTAEKFVDCPFGTGGKMYRSGDFGAWTVEGTLLFSGRSDSQVKVNGLRIDLNEITRAVQTSPILSSSRLIARRSDAGRTELVMYYQRAQRMELVPSLGEYGIYDVFLYESMASDKMRVNGYRSALAEKVRGKVVLDPGTGSQLVLARHCIDAGAARVYAIEIDEYAFQEARQNIRRFGLEGKIVLIKGDIAEIPPLPERVDVVVSALAGNVASADGSIPIVQKIQKLVPGANYVPNRYVTRIAGFALDEQRTVAGLSDISGHYIDALFEKYARPFDFRLCIQNMSHECILTDVQDAEDIRYETALQVEETTDLTLTVAKDGCLSGFALWLNAYSDDQLMIDSAQKTHHLPVYLPILAGAVLDVSVGDLVRLTFVRSLAEDGLHPDYEIVGALQRVNGAVVAFRCSSPQVSPGFRAQPLYAKLMTAEGKPAITAATSAVSVSSALRQHLQPQLPAYMIPHQFVEVQEWPLTAHGKIDDNALLTLASGADRSGADFAAPTSSAEVALCRIWSEVLDHERIGIDDNLFGLGCDSIRVIQAVHKARTEHILMEPADVMLYQTIRSLALHVREHGQAHAGAASADARLAALASVQLFTQLDEAEKNSLPAGTEDAYPASAMQMLMLDAYAADQRPDGIYHCCTVWQIQDQDLSPEALLGALQLLYATERSLRTTFMVSEAGRCLQLVRQPGQVVIPYVDLRHTGCVADDVFFRAQISRDIAQRFQPFEPGEPLCRFRVWRTADNACSLLFSFHHSLLDGWSGIELRNTLLDFYATLKQGQRPMVAERASDSRKEFVALERAVCGDSSERRFWAARIAEEGFRRGLHAIAMLEHGNASGLHEMATYTEAMTPEVVHAAQEGAMRAGVQLKAMFLNSIAHALLEVLGARDITIGVVMNGRSDRLSDPLHTTGLFWNIVPLSLGTSLITPQKTQAELNQIDTVGNFPLRELEQQLIGAPLRIPSFNFVNFHNVENRSAISVTEALVNDRFHFPINIFVSLEQSATGMSGLWRVEFDRALFDQRQVKAIIRLGNQSIFQQVNR